MKSHFRMFAAYNAWANRHLSAAVSKLPDEDYRLDRGAFFKSIHGTLNHLIVADRIWMKRFTAEGDEIADFVLNRPAYRTAEILVAGDNFGCGSSREHAPWALLDFGIRCVITTSFADIFYNNCFKNGILPIVLTEDQVAALMDDARRGANARMSVDLEAQTVTASDGTAYGFQIDPFRKHCLMNGLDDIALTLERKPQIEAYEAKLKTRAWA